MRSFALTSARKLLPVTTVADSHDSLLSAVTRAG
jgi:hypothetical protein